MQSSSNSACLETPAQPPAQPRANTIPVFASRIGTWHISLHRQPLNAADLATNYDRAAADWNSTIQRLDYVHAYQAILEKSLQGGRLASAQAGLRALDCGTGTGAMSEALANVAGKQTRLDAIDISSRMLVKAGDRFDEAGLSYSLRQGDVRRLPYDDNTFDIAMAGHLLEHLPNPATAIHEMVRVVRPGGLVLACLTRRTVLGLYIHLKWRTHMLLPAQGEDWLRECGLKEIRCVSSNSQGLFRHLSFACVGTKPELPVDDFKQTA